jgi:hypothetical protein
VDSKSPVALGAGMARRCRSAPLMSEGAGESRAYRGSARANAAARSSAESGGGKLLAGVSIQPGARSKPLQTRGKTGRGAGEAATEKEVWESVEQAQQLPALLPSRRSVEVGTSHGPQRHPEHIVVGECGELEPLSKEVALDPVRRPVVALRLRLADVQRVILHLPTPRSVSSAYARDEEAMPRKRR